MEKCRIHDNRTKLGWLKALSEIKMEAPYAFRGLAE